MVSIFTIDINSTFNIYNLFGIYALQIFIFVITMYIVFDRLKREMCEIYIGSYCKWQWTSVNMSISIVLPSTLFKQAIKNVECLFWLNINRCTCVWVRGLLTNHKTNLVYMFIKLYYYLGYYQITDFFPQVILLASLSGFIPYNNFLISTFTPKYVCNHKTYFRKKDKCI